MFYLFLLVFNAFAQPNWEDWANRLTGESDYVRTQSILHLKSTLNLENILRHELTGPRKFLVLDVIAALKLNSLLKDLLKISKIDQSVFFYNTINILITDSNQSAILNEYNYRLMQKNTSAGVKVVILDTFTRIGFDLKRKDIESLLFYDPSPEVRSASLNYLRDQFLKKEFKHKDIYLLKRVLHQNPFQVRIQALYIIAELYTKLQNIPISKLKTAAQLEIESDFKANLNNYMSEDYGLDYITSLSKIIKANLHYFLSQNCFANEDKTFFMHLNKFDFASLFAICQVDANILVRTRCHQLIEILKQ